MARHSVKEGRRVVQDQKRETGHLKSRYFPFNFSSYRGHSLLAVEPRSSSLILTIGRYGSDFTLVAASSSAVLFFVLRRAKPQRTTGHVCLLCFVFFPSLFSADNVVHIDKNSDLWLREVKQNWIERPIWRPRPKHKFTRITTQVRCGMFLILQRWWLMIHFEAASGVRVTTFQGNSALCWHFMKHNDRAASTPVCRKRLCALRI